MQTRRMGYISRVIRKARRLDSIHGFGIDQVAAAAEQPARANLRWPVLRLENLDTDLPLPPDALRVTREALETAAANSWLPFTGDVALREAIADFTAERTGHRYDPEREIVITVGGMEGLLDVLLATVDPGDEVVVTDPTYAGIVNRIRVAGGTPKLVPFRVVEGEWRLDRDALAAAVGAKTTGMLLMSPSMPSGGTFDEEDWRLACDLCRDRELFLVYDAAMERLLFDGWPLVRPGGGWSLLLDVAALGFVPEEASRLLLEESSIAATGMRGWGGEVAERYVRFVFSAEPVERLETIPERLADGSLARAL